MPGREGRHVPGRERTPARGRGTSAAQLGHLVQAMGRAETPDEVARVLAEEGSAAAGAQFANIAVLDGGTAGETAHLHHASSLIENVARRYTAIPVDDSTPLGTVLRSGGEVWLRSLAEIGTRFPALLEDTKAAGLASTASLALHGRHQRVIGAMGVGWAHSQRFTGAQKERVRVVAQLAADALRRAQVLEAEREDRRRAERLQRAMTALVASASLTEVTAAVLEHGLPPFGACAARLALADPQRPGLLVTVDAAVVPESLRARWQAVPAFGTPSQEALAASALVYVPTPQELAARYPSAHKAVTGTGQQAWVALPLRSGGRALGVLTLAFPVPHPLDDGPGQIGLTALGSAVADALSRAIQHDSDRDLVESVQRSLLAGTLPENPQVRLGACYLPAEIRYGIGGDWYDALPLPGGRTLRYCLAGHPPMLLRGPGGSVTPLEEARRPMLGLETGAHPEQVVTYLPGSVLVLFTDGLIERRGEVFDTGLGRLTSALAAATARDPASMCEALFGQALPPAVRSDDTAILCAFLA